MGTYVLLSSHLKKKSTVGRTLDGQAMQITLDSDSNVRQGLFGTALRDDKDVKFKVSFG